ncbi:aspartate/glutamate racemase family protein [Utexia brackfieldae]|uniref:aspartate/glutamate racemase family protein n=1 Tax=Utexia brackfieldae TaxID=3074108 RepID=UPI00370D8019
MKTIGLLGGMSFESTITYYQLINQTINKQLGGLHSAKIILYSVDFQEIEQCQAAGDWDKSAEILIDAALRLKKAGADYLVICTNTMHKVAPQIQQAIGLPLLHIAQVTADALKQANIHRVALLGTRYTMEQDFYKALIIQAGIDVLIPDENDRLQVNRIIYDELCHGQIKSESKQIYLAIINKLISQGAQGIILGCTEIGLLINQQDVSVQVFDTTLLHANAAAISAI